MKTTVMDEPLVGELPGAATPLSGVVLSESGFLACVTAPLYLLGHMLFSLVMHTSSSMSTRRLFALTFAVSGALLLLVLLEVYGSVPAGARRLLWQLHLSIDLVLVVIVIPFVLLTLGLRHLLHQFSAWTLWPSVVLTLLVWLYLFLKVGDAFPTTRGSTGSSEPISQLLSLVLSRASVFGVCLSAIMSGVGAVAGISLSLRRMLHDDDPAEIDESQRGLINALQRLAKHKQRLHGIHQRLAALHEGTRRRREAAASARSARQLQARRALETGDWSGAAVAVGAVAADALPELAGTLFRSSSTKEALGELRLAQGEAQRLSGAVRREVAAFARLLDEQRRWAFEGTAWGRVLVACGDLFSLYCVVKVGLATCSILMHGARAPGLDPVTRCIDYALRLSILDPAATALYSQGVSLLLTGAMIFSSVCEPAEQARGRWSAAAGCWLRVVVQAGRRRSLLLTSACGWRVDARRCAAFSFRLRALR